MSEFFGFKTGSTSKSRAFLQALHVPPNNNAVRAVMTQETRSRNLTAVVAGKPICLCALLAVIQWRGVILALSAIHL